MAHHGPVGLGLGRLLRCDFLGLLLDDDRLRDGILGDGFGLLGGLVDDNVLDRLGYDVLHCRLL